MIDRIAGRSAGTVFWRVKVSVCLGVAQQKHRVFRIISSGGVPFPIALRNAVVDLHSENTLQFFCGDAAFGNESFSQVRREDVSHVTVL